MADSFRTRIPTLSEAELRQYVERPLEYRSEAVEAALAELERRGLALPAETVDQVHRHLEQRDHASASRVGLTSWFQPARLRIIAVSMLVMGLGSALAIYLTLPPPSANPLGYEPEDTKKYLRDLELYGGKVNVLATRFNHWFDGLWHGRQLAFTVAWLSVFVACAAWFVARRQRPSSDTGGGLR